MKKLICSLCVLLCFSAAAQFAWPGAVAKKKQPQIVQSDWAAFATNFTHFWDADGSGWVTNAGVYTLVDQVAGKNLTNTSSSTAPLVGPTLNGYRTLSFTNHRLQNDSVTATNTDSFAIIWVTANTNKGLSSIICIGTNSVAQMIANTFILQAFAGLTVNVFNPMTTNTWVIRCQVFNQSSSYGWENLTKSGNVNPGTADLRGLVWGQNPAGSFASLQQVAMIGILSPAPSVNDWTNSTGFYQTIKSHYGL